MSEAESPSVVPATTVDVLIARLSTHPEEFFVAEAVITQDGARIFAGTKWRRITTMLMTPMNAEGNMWLELFSDEEKERFKTAMLEALRGVIDTQMMRVLTGGDPVELDFEEKQRRQELAMQQQLYNVQRAGALQNMANPILTGTLTGGYGGPPLPPLPMDSSYDEYLSRQQYEQEKRRAAKSPPPFSVRDKIKKFFP